MTSASTRRRVQVRAPAKINLTLRVLGTRPDGYHELRTMFQSLALHDTLTFTPSDGPLSIDCDDPRCPLQRGQPGLACGGRLVASRRPARQAVRRPRRYPQADSD